MYLQNLFLTNLSQYLFRKRSDPSQETISGFILTKFQRGNNKKTEKTKQKHNHAESVLDHEIKASTLVSYLNIWTSKEFCGYTFIQKHLHSSIYKKD